MIDLEKATTKAQLLGSFLEFDKFFFEYLTRRPFIVSNPISRESHHITIARALTQAFRLEIPEHRLIINVPPGYSKSVMVSMWVAWTLAHYPDSQYLYLSYSHDLAAKHTSFIKQIVGSAMYKYLFEVEVSHESRAKDFFKTTAGGSIRAFGSAGSVTGQDAGLPNLDRFSGACIIDDPLKPDDAHSSSLRETVIRNYEETIRQRTRGINVPIVFIGQRLHEDDLAAYLVSGRDTHVWTPLILKALDDTGNALYPEKDPKSLLLQLQEKSPYVFASQYQQNPIPAGGALFRPGWFVSLLEEPKMLMTFITVDTSETSKTYNDASAFSFWGLYEIETFGRKTDELGLHWIDCLETRVEPRDLKDTFLDFWQECMRYTTPPLFAAIEKKSTGTTLLSVLEDLRGLQVRNIERTRASGSKTQRFLEIQPYLASKRVSIPHYGKHKEIVINHMSKITANDTHRFDDIADTCADAIRIALIDKILYKNTALNEQKAATIIGKQRELMKARSVLYGGQDR